MAEKWAQLEKEVLGILSQGVSDFASETKAALGDFLKKKAKQIAEHKWRSITAKTVEERERGESTLKHLYAQVEGEIIRTEIAVTKRAGDLLTKVLQVGIDAIRRIAPKMIGG